MLLHESFSTALAAAHRADLLAQAERHRTVRHVLAARAALRLRSTGSAPPPDPAEGNSTPERRYAMSR